jgi:triosephosphate isomerase
MRRPAIAANWKMHKTAGEARAFVEDFLPRVKDAAGVDVILAPPFTALESMAAALRGSAVALAAQNVNAEEKGAFTGEIAPSMLSDLDCAYVIVGHSERRTLYGESDATVAAKAAAGLRHGLRPIVCVGESLEDREAGRTESVIGRQLEGSLAGLPEDRAEELVVAYEPIWAIGTGRTATPELAQEVHAAIRARLVERFGEAAHAIRIQYGGSVKPDNVRALMAQPDIDGALVGGASLEPGSFARIVHFEREGAAE